MYLYALITIVNQVCQRLGFSSSYAFHFLITSGEKKHESESQSNFCLMNSPATKFWVPSLDGCCQKGLGCRGKRDSADFWVRRV